MARAQGRRPSEERRVRRRVTSFCKYCHQLTRGRTPRRSAGYFHQLIEVPTSGGLSVDNGALNGTLAQKWPD